MTLDALVGPRVGARSLARPTTPALSGKDMGFFDASLGRRVFLLCLVSGSMDMCVHNHTPINCESGAAQGWMSSPWFEEGTLTMHQGHKALIQRWMSISSWVDNLPQR